jgi:hypothetical protein
MPNTIVTILAITPRPAPYSLSYQIQPSDTLLYLSNLYTMSLMRGNSATGMTTEMAGSFVSITA